MNNTLKQILLFLVEIKPTMNDRIILSSQLPLFEERGTIPAAELLIALHFQAIDIF